MTKPKDFSFEADQVNTIHGYTNGAFLEIDMDGFGLLNPKRESNIALEFKSEHVPVQLTEEQLTQVMNAYTLRNDQIGPGVYYVKSTAIGAKDRFAPYYRAYLALLGRPQWYTLVEGQRVYAVGACRGDAEIIKIGKHSANVKMLATGQLIKLSYKDMHLRHGAEIGRMAHVLAAVKCGETRQNETLKVLEGVEIPVFGDVDDAFAMLVSKPLPLHITLVLGSDDVLRIVQHDVMSPKEPVAFDISYENGAILDVRYVR